MLQLIVVPHPHRHRESCARPSQRVTHWQPTLHAGLWVDRWQHRAFVSTLELKRCIKVAIVSCFLVADAISSQHHPPCQAPRSVASSPPLLFAAAPSRRRSFSRRFSPPLFLAAGAAPFSLSPPLLLGVLFLAVAHRRLRRVATCSRSKPPCPAPGRVRRWSERAMQRTAAGFTFAAKEARATTHHARLGV